MKLEYPIDIKSLEDSFRVTNQYGLYPISRFNSWHGGIHVEGFSKAIKNIADGKVIAYRVYSNPNDKEDINYSNGFILVQHYYQSKDSKIKFTFYSLYNHLMSKEEYESSDVNKSRIPDFFAKFIYKVSKEANEQLVGLETYKLNEKKKLDRANPVFFIKGKSIEYVLDKDGKKQVHSYYVKKNGKDIKRTYHKIKGEDYRGVYFDDVYASSSCIKENKINYQKDKITKEKGSYIKEVIQGTIKYKAPNINSEQLEVLEREKVLDIDLEKSKGDWLALKGGGYVKKSKLSTIKEFNSDKIDFNSVQKCDIPIPTGLVVGGIGDYGTTKNPNYKVAHLEVFSFDDPSEFLKGGEEAKKDENKTIFKIGKGAKLQNNVKRELNLKKDTPVKILEINDDFCCIETFNPKATVLYEHLIDRVTKNGYYTIKDDYTKKEGEKEITVECFNKIKLAFEMYKNNPSKADYLKSDSKLYYHSGYKIDGVIQKTRTISFYPKANKCQKFWVANNDAIFKKKVKVVDKEHIFQDGIIQKTEIKKVEEITLIKPSKGDVITLQLAIKEAYLNKPAEPLNGEQLLEEPFFTKSMRALKQDKKITHYKVADKGWIKADSDKIKKISPLDWTEFGFKALNGGKEYCYSVKDINRGENSTSAFIQEVWNNIDTNKDKIIDVKELDKVKNNRNKLTQLSKLVCKHKSEWSYSPDEIEDEVKEYHKLELDKSVGEQKKKLEEEQNKQIEAIKTRVENLSFWDKVEHGESEYVHQGIYNFCKEPWFGEEVKKKTARFFDTNQNEVWHFHPIAFVEQMKLISGPKYQPDHGDWHDPIVNPQVRGHYGGGHYGIHSEHAGWDTDRSRAIKRRLNSKGVARMHHGLDIYAPVGTPIYACQDFRKVTRHQFRKNKAGGFDLNFGINYNGKYHTIVYCHMINFRESDFCLGGVNGKSAEYHTYKSCSTTKKIQLKHTNGSLEKNAVFEVTYDSQLNTLTIDEMVVDLDIAKKNYEGVSKNDLPKKGDVVGYVGMTGNAVQHRNTAHLHLAMYDSTGELEPAQVLKKYITNEEEGHSRGKQDGYTPSSEW